jgi:hypothetical protein
MFDVLEISLTGGEVKRMKEGTPAGVQVDISIDRVVPKTTDSVVLEFTYAVDYKPDYAKVRISGEVVCRDTPDNVRKAIAEFKKKKSLPEDISGNLVNMINENAGLNSVFLVRPFNLLPPFMPPMMVPAQKIAPKPAGGKQE